MLCSTTAMNDSQAADSNKLNDAQEVLAHKAPVNANKTQGKCIDHGQDDLKQKGACGSLFSCTSMGLRSFSWA